MPKIIILIFLLLSCNHNNLKLDKEYIGFWAESTWIYKFKKSGEFVFETKGHVGESIKKGSYVINGEQVILIPNTDWFEENDVLKKEMKILNDTCLKDYHNNYYCLSGERLDELWEKEYKFQGATIDILNKFDIVKEELSTVQIQDDGSLPRINYIGIVRFNKDEYHRFSLRRYNKEYCRYTNYLDFLVKQKPMKIYLSDWDSLKLMKIN